MTADEPLRALIAKWRERDQKLCRQADAQPTTQYAKTLADRAECYGRCADELEAALPLRPQDEPRRADFLALFQQAARDESLTDREVRNIVRYISAEPLTERDMQRTRELAKKYGWEADPLPVPSPSQEPKA